MRPAVELSYLDEDCQRDVVDEIDMNDATPSHDQTIRMRKFFDEGQTHNRSYPGNHVGGKAESKRKNCVTGATESTSLSQQYPRLSQTGGLRLQGFGALQQVSQGRGLTVTADNAFLVPPSHTLPPIFTYRLPAEKIYSISLKYIYLN